MGEQLKMKRDLDTILEDIEKMENIFSMSPFLSKKRVEEISFKEKKEIIKKLINDLQNNIIPYEYPSFILQDSAFFMLRDKIIKEQGFALVCEKWIKPLAEWIGDRKCLEVMSGTGALSYALKEQGINIIATDDFSWNGIASWNNEKKYFTNVEKIDCIEAIRKYGKDIDIVIMSWAYMDDCAYKTLLEMRKVNPNAVMLVIGESQGGCTADDNFFEAIHRVEDEKIYYIDSLYDTWFGLHDHLMLVK